MSESFVYTFPLKTPPKEFQELDKRIDASRSIYLATLGEALKRLKLCRESKGWQKAKKIRVPKKKKGKKRTKEEAKKAKERKLLFDRAKKRYGFSSYSLHAWIKDRKNACFLSQHIDASTMQKQSDRAFQAVEQYSLGKRGKPRFRSKGRFRSVEGKSNKTGIRFLEDRFVWNIKNGKKLVLEPIFDLKDKCGVEAHALSSKVKYSRILRKKIRGEKRYFGQVICKGKSLLKDKNKTVGNKKVGLDIGHSTIAVVHKNNAFLKGFCEELSSIGKEKKRLQKKTSRSLRLNNPNNFDEKGAVKKGAKKWVRSKRYINLKNKTDELERKIAEHRKRLHGKLANSILQEGTQIRMEKISYRSFQKNFGRSVGLRAPGLFVSLLRRKAERAGGNVEEFSTYKTALSQTCICDRPKEKKKLSERWHQCPCGVVAQRDLFSAYLAQFVEEDTLDIPQAQRGWVAAQPLLQHAISRLDQQAIGRLRLSSFGLGQSRSLSHAKENGKFVEAIDVVGKEETSCPRAMERHSVSSWNPLDLSMGRLRRQDKDN